MTNKKKQQAETPIAHELARGQINHNALAALVTSPLFRAKTEKPKKGKGSFSRKVKYKGKEPYFSLMLAA